MMVAVTEPTVVGLPWFSLAPWQYKQRYISVAPRILMLHHSRGVLGSFVQ